MSDAERQAPGARLSPEDRRARIVEATVSVLAAEPPHAWTLRQVAKEAGVAPSLINYFFGSWDGLLLATYRALCVRYRDEVEAVLAGAESDPERAIDRYLDHFFSDHWTSDRVTGAYVALWALARGEVALGSEMEAFTAAQRGDLKRLIAACARQPGGAQEVGRTVETLYMLLSGLWYELAVNPAALSADSAKALARAALDALARRER